MYHHVRIANFHGVCLAQERDFHAKPKRALDAAPQEVEAVDGKGNNPKQGKTGNGVLHLNKEIVEEGVESLPGVFPHMIASFVIIHSSIIRLSSSLSFIH